MAVTHDDIDGAVHAALERAGFLPVSCPVLQQGPPPDPKRLEIEARRLESFDWVICSSVRSVRAPSRMPADRNGRLARAQQPLAP